MKKTKDQSLEAKMLTDVELELMTYLWKIGQGTVSDVLQQLPPERSLAYTSVSTVLRILEQKKIVEARKEGRGHIYVPLMSKSSYESKTVRHVVDRVFEGTPTALVKQLLDTMNLKKEDLDELKELIAKAKSQL